MNIKNLNIEDDDYSLHVKGECDIDCKFCIEEQEEYRRKNKKNKKNESDRI